MKTFALALATAALMAVPAIGAQSAEVRSAVSAPAAAGNAAARSGVSAPIRNAEEADPWFGPDKAKHFFLSAFLQGVGYAGLRSMDVEHGAALAGASVATLGFGIAKEMSDRRGGRRISGRDLLWDALGAGAASALLARTQR